MLATPRFCEGAIIYKKNEVLIELQLMGGSA
jgi:hypothetical protein